MYETILHEWFEEVWNKGSEEAVRRLVSPDAIIHKADEEGRDAIGPEAFLEFFRRFRTAFPDMRVTVEDAVVSGNKVAGRWVARATHRGEGLGFPATARPIEVNGMSIAHFRNGQVVEGWNVWDNLAMMQQLGFTLAAQAGR